MAITFDQLLQCITRERKPEEGFPQGSAHTVGRLFEQWKRDILTNAQIIEILNLDSGDSELTTVKTTFNGMNNAEALAVEGALILATDQISAAGISYDKAHLRTLFGL